MDRPALFSLLTTVATTVMLSATTLVAEAKGWHRHRARRGRRPAFRLCHAIGTAGLCRPRRRRCVVVGVHGGQAIINTENDTYIADTRHMFEVAAEPKTLEIYPGGEHAMSTVPAAHGAEAKARIVKFINDVMPL